MDRNTPYLMACRPSVIRFAGVDQVERSLGHGNPSKFEKYVLVKPTCRASAFILAMNASSPGP